MWSSPFLPRLVDTTVSRETFRGSTFCGAEVYGQLPNGLSVCFAHGHHVPLGLDSTSQQTYTIEVDCRRKHGHLLLGWMLKQTRRTHLRSIVGGSMFGFTHDGMCNAARWSAGSGSEGVERCTSPPCADTSLLLSRCPSLLTPLGVLPVACGTGPSFTRPWGQQPRPWSQHSSLHGGPQ